MIILHITKKYPPALGGDATVVSQLQKHQQKRGYKTIILTSRCAGLKPSDNLYLFGLSDTAANLDAITPRRLFSLVLLFLKIFWVLAKEKPDVVHTHSIDMAFIVSFAARLYHLPLVHTFHIVTFYDPQQSKFRRFIELWLVRRARLYRITAPNSYDVEKLRQAGFSQTVLLPNGVDYDFWERREARAKNHTFQFIAVGRLEAQKGYNYLLKAVSILAGLNAQFRLRIVGDGSQLAALKKLASDLNITHLVSFEGRKTPEEVRDLLFEADAAVFPSLYETTPLTLLEAWAAGVPVIATSVGILRDRQQQAACVVVPSRNEQALANAMRQLMENKAQRQTITKSGRAEAKQYDWPVIARTAEMVYRGSE